MSPDRFVYESLSDVGLPGARMLWGPQPPDPPYFTYEERPSSAFADNATLPEIPRYRAKLFMRSIDERLERRFREAVGKLGTFVAHPAVYDDGLVVFTFDFTLVNWGDR